MKAADRMKRLNPGHYTYKGWEIEKMESGQWNIRPVEEDFWCDAANSLAEARRMIDLQWDFS